ncbi:Cytochrome P450 84A1 [Hibiscus syriacus]|uniref:Cytochrome P450 84A1 n=1 Tax=Hibiscus syriacus TaxID=106335 RepID=A0A6A3AK63_HIBSY|nr:Cytochrome P450 84A1 [Hibiscus syriacus]
MEPFPMSLLFVIIPFLFLLPLIYQLRRKPFPPEPIGLPIIGNMLMMDQLTHRGLAKLAHRYGGIFHLKMWPATIAISYLTYDRADMAFAHYGPFWRQMRKLCVVNLFSRKRAESWESVRDEVENLVRAVSSNDGKAINVALGVIRLTLSRNVAFNIAKEKTTAGLMAALSSMYEKSSASNKVHLMRRLFNLRMAEGASMAQHLNELNTITTQLSSVEIEFDDEVRALILLSSLPDSWNATVTAVSSSSGNSKLKFDDVRDLVLSEEIRRRESGEASTSSALHTESRGRTSERNSNHGRSKSRRGKSTTGKKDFTCYNCGKKGHFKRDCRALKKNTDAQESANVTGDSGDFGKVHLADDETLKILDGEGFSTTFSGCEWKITKGALFIARGKKTGTLYITSNLENIIAVANADGKSNLWHQRLGHMSEKGMKTLLSKGKLPDLKNVDVGLCEDCIFGKQKKVSFAKIGKTPKAEMLELVHTDVWGPSPVPSLAGSLYYVTFIDDSTRKVWVYFLNKKSEVFDTFRKWKAMVENETGMKVKRLRSDNGGEYRNRRFRDFCANNGIKMETTVPMTPQQNGVAERMNRTLNERARSMRIHAGLPKFLWAEAINTASYLINRGPSVPLDGRIPDEVWSKKEINLSRLRVFGFISYVHIDSAERSKLDAKSTVESSSSNTKAETKEFAEFEEISGNDVQISPEAVQEEPGTPELRRSSRIPKPTQRYSPSLHYLLLTDNGEPECYDEAMQVEDSVKWESSMKDEMDSLWSNQTWELAELPPGKKALHNKWIYRIKEEHDGSKRYKARLVIKGFQQKEGINYNEIFSPVVKLSTIRLVLKIIAAGNLHLEQLDVKTAFLHGDLEEEIYMRQPEGFIEADKKNLVCRLKKSLYGLKQAPRQWYKKFDSFMSSSGFTRCQADHCCYIKRLRHARDYKLEVKIVSKQFAMKDQGAAKQIIGTRIKRDTKSGTLILSQAEYINKVLSRPDIAQAVGAVSRYMNNPGKVHWEAVKWILRYLRGTTNKALCFKGGDTILTGYVDADLAGNIDIRRSTTGYVYTLGGTAVSWVSQLQKIVALSTTEAEYVAVTEASKEMVWLQSFLEELGKKQENNVLYCDSQSAIHLAKNPSFHSRTEHIQLRYHFIMYLLEDEILKLEKISGAQNPADMLTKTVTIDKLKLCSTSVGMLEAAFGSSSQEGQDEFIKILQEFSKLFGAFNIADFIPWLGWVDPQGLNSRLQKARFALDKFIDTIIDDHIQKRKSYVNGCDGGGDGDYGETDMFDELLAFYNEAEVNESDDLNSIRLTRDNIKAIIMDVMFGGTETVASAIEWALTELMRSPEDMKRVQRELAEVVGLDRRMEEYDLDKLPYLKCCLKETLRLHPPIPLLLHETTEEAVGAGFLNEGVPDFKGGNFEFISFGSGRRSCPGMQLGLYSLDLAVGHLLHYFTWELPDWMKPTELDMSDEFGLTAPRAARLYAVPTKRLVCPLF